MLKESPSIFAISPLEGDVVVGSDDRIGTVKDFLSSMTPGRCAGWWSIPARGCPAAKC
jgi:hypothetical protein